MEADTGAWDNAAWPAPAFAPWPAWAAPPPLEDPEGCSELAATAPAQEELLLWRDPKKSGAALGASTAAFLFLQFAHINLLQTVAFTLLTLVLGCFLWNNLARQASPGDPALACHAARTAARPMAC